MTYLLTSASLGFTSMLNHLAFPIVRHRAMQVLLRVIDELSKPFNHTFLLSFTLKIRLICLLVAAVFLVPPVGGLAAAGDAGGNEPATYEQLEELAAGRKWAELVAVLNQKDLAEMAVAVGQPADRLYALRGRANSVLKRGPEAEKDYRAAIELVPNSGEYWAALGANYRDNLKNSSAALEAFEQSICISFGVGNRLGYLPISSTIDAAGILCSDGKYDEALYMLNRYDESTVAGMAPVWRAQMSRAFGKIYLAQGREKEAMDCFQKALEIEPPQK